MTITYATPEQVGPESVKLAWTTTETAPTFRVYCNGSLLVTTMQPWWIFRVVSGVYPIIEVLDTDSATPTEVFPSTETLGWYADSDVHHWLVEQYVGAAWLECAEIENEGDLYYTWTSIELADAASHQFRITAYDAAGNASSSTTRTCLMVRHPDPPTASYTYASGTGKVTVTVS
jgi:hypothetical protein